MDFAVDDFVKIVVPNGNYRYGYVSAVKEEGDHIEIWLGEEGESKICFDAAAGGKTPDEWDKMLSPAEKKLIPLLTGSLSPKDMGDHLHLSVVTVREHMRRMRLKLELDNNEQLVAWAQGFATYLFVKGEVDARTSDKD